MPKDGPHAANQCLIFAHRGASAVAPANTWPAFEMAIKMGADVLETDVHWTKDGVLVICHDETVDKVSNGSGRIADMTYQELVKLDFGYTFTIDGGKTYPFRDKGVSIVCFEDLLKQLPNVRVNVDLKPKRARVGSFLSVVERAKAFDRVTLASFHHRTLREARGRCPLVQTSASTLEVVQFLLRYPQLSYLWRKQPPAYVALQVPNKVLRRPLVSRGFVRRAHHMQVQVHVWTVNHVSDMERLMNLGVDGIVTDVPDTARSVLIPKE